MRYTSNLHLINKSISNKSGFLVSVDTKRIHFLYEVDKPQAVSRLLKIRCNTREIGIVVPSWMILSARMRR